MVRRPDKTARPRTSVPQRRRLPRLLAKSLFLPLSLDARKCPMGRFGEDMILRTCEMFQQIADSSVIRHAPSKAGIPNRNTAVAHQTTPFGALDWACTKEFPKVSLGKTKEPLQSRKLKRLVLRRSTPHRGGHFLPPDRCRLVRAYWASARGARPWCYRPVM